MVLTIQQQLRYTLKLIRTSDIFKFNYNGSFFLLFVPDTAATGNCNCGAHHLTTAEVLNFLSFCIYIISLNFLKKHSYNFLLLLLFVSWYRTTGNCNCSVHYLLEAEVLN